MNSVEITVIIPTLNEESVLLQTLESLGRQQRVTMEIIVVDGGSTDASRQIARESLQPVRVMVTPPGRSRQLNAGAARAQGEYLLFLHADSWFPDPLAIRKGIDQLRHAARQAPASPAGGHYSLTFARNSSPPSTGYTYYERKARLSRPGCCHGDQGFILSRTLFNLTGPFSEQGELLAQTRYADRLRSNGQWLRLEAEIISSARRFESEGLYRRQMLNAVIMACGAAGRDDFLQKIPDIYRQQGEISRISLKPFLRQVDKLIAALPAREKQVLWQRIGGYAVDNAWQAAFFLDIVAGFGQKDGRLVDQTPLLQLYDRYLHRMLNNRMGRVCAQYAVRCCFSLALLPPSALIDDDASP